MNPEILDHGEVLYIEILERGQSLRLATLAGKCAAIHSSRSAKAISAFLRENRLQELLALARMVRVTDRTSTDVEKLQLQLRLARQRGYAMDNQEDVRGGACVGAPLFDSARQPVATLSLSGPAERILGKRQQIIAALRTASVKMSRRLGCADPKETTR